MNFCFGFISFAYRSMWNSLQLPALKATFSALHLLRHSSPFEQHTSSFVHIRPLHTDTGGEQVPFIFLRRLYKYKCEGGSSQYEEGTETQILCPRVDLLWDRGNGSQISFLHVQIQAFLHRLKWLLTIIQINIVTVSHIINRKTKLSLVHTICTLHSGSIPVPHLACLIKA